MDLEQLLQKAMPLAGGEANISRTDQRADSLHITVKDVGEVDLERSSRLVFCFPRLGTKTWRQRSAMPWDRSLLI